MYDDDETVVLEAVRARRWQHRRARSHWPMKMMTVLTIPTRVTTLITVLALVSVGAGSWLLWNAYASVYGQQANVKRSQTSLDSAWGANGSNPGTAVVAPASSPTAGRKGNSGPSTPVPVAPVASLPAPIAKLMIPSLGMTWYVVQGVDDADLAVAPGHYPGTAMPGVVGNFAVAGHREPGMFWDLDRVTSGQQVIVETHTMRYTYTVRASVIVKPTDVAQVAAVPPGFAAGDHVLTLTTCNPKWDNYQRLIVHAMLTGTTKI
jgi:sortase A